MGLVIFLTVFGHFTQSRLRASSRALATTRAMRVQDRQEAESKLKDAESRIGTLIDTIDEVFYTCHVDENWTAVFLSPAFERMTGYAVDEVIGSRVLSLADLIHPDDREQTKPLGDELSGNEFQLTYRIITKSGD